MKTIIAGCRSFYNPAYLKHVNSHEVTNTLQNQFNFCANFLNPHSPKNIPNKLSKNIIITEVVSGGAKGIDTLGEHWAKNNDIPIKVFQANWDLHGKSAGIIRNKEMGNYADILVAFWDYKSRGTKHMIGYMHSLDKPVYIIDLRTYV